MHFTILVKSLVKEQPPQGRKKLEVSLTLSLVSNEATVPFPILHSSQGGKTKRKATNVVYSNQPLEYWLKLPQPLHFAWVQR
jgi:hypothetical protein